MFIFAFVAAVLAALVFIGRGASYRARQWRVISGVAAAAVLAGAAILVLRGQWIVGAVIAAIGGVMVLSARMAPAAETPPAKPAPANGMSETEARSLLGIGPNDGPAEISAAYHRLMQRVHPDKGGAAGLAAQINAARERLIGKSR